MQNKIDPSLWDELLLLVLLEDIGRVHPCEQCLYVFKSCRSNIFNLLKLNVFTESLRQSILVF